MPQEADYLAGRAKSLSRKLRADWRDYTKDGWYFVTLGADYHRPLFGKVENGRMIPNRLGELVERCWREIPEHFPAARMGVCQVMPTHFHGLIYLTRSNVHHLGVLIKQYKSSVTRIFRKTVPSMDGADVWQPNYYEVICFDIEELEQKENYIRANPLRWGLRDLEKGWMKESRFLGNRTLRDSGPFKALRISRKATPAEIRQAIAAIPNFDGVIVSTFFSPGERQVLDVLLASETARVIWLVPMALSDPIPVKWTSLLVSGRGLWISPFPDDPEPTAINCRRCNELAERMEKG